MNQRNRSHLTWLIWIMGLSALWPSILIARADELKPAASSPAPKTVLVLGDSIAAGYGLDPSQAFPTLLQSHIDLARLPFRVVNAGLSGDTSAGGLRRIDWLLKRPAEVLVIELGGNDGLRGLSPQNTKSNLKAIIEKAKAKYPQIRIVLAGMQMPPNLGPEYVEHFNRIYPELAKESGAMLIPFVLAGVGGKPELNLPDRIHPTAEGHKIVAENVWKLLGPLLSELADPK